MRLLLVSFYLLSSSFASAAPVFSHTFFSERPNFQSAMPERVSLFRNELLNNCEGFGGAFEAVVYGGNITEQGILKMAKFFLPPGCTTTFLNVKEFNPAREENPSNTDDGTLAKNLEARHFNIRTVNESFASTISIRPKQSKIGFGFCYKQVLSQKCDGTPNFWFEAALPIECVTNHVCLSEKITDDGGGPIEAIGLDNAPIVGNMKQAFSQKTWLYGKIPNKRIHKCGVADIELKFGYNGFRCDTCDINTYGSLIIPTGTHVRQHVLFEPIVGNNRHFGISLGSSFAFDFWKKGCYTIQMFVDNDTRYLFSNRQVRTFDLIGKPWGRYMSTYKTPEDAAAAAASGDQNSGTSGINIFTQCVRVSPHLSANFNTGFLLSRKGDRCSFQLEGGYNFFARQEEFVDLECNDKIATSALKGVNGMGTTTVARTIKDNFPASVFTFSERYAALSPCNVDLESACHPATIANTIYATLGYRWDCECPLLIAMGGSYEFTVLQVNTATDRWLVWAKFAFTF